MGKTKRQKQRFTCRTCSKIMFEGGDLFGGSRRQTLELPAHLLGKEYFERGTMLWTPGGGYSGATMLHPCRDTFLSFPKAFPTCIPPVDASTNIKNNPHTHIQTKERAHAHVCAYKRAHTHTHTNPSAHHCALRKHSNTKIGHTNNCKQSQKETQHISQTNMHSHTHTHTHASN